jgi:hypothetical protein
MRNLALVSLVLVVVGTFSPAMALKCASIEYEIHTRVVDAVTGADLPGSQVILHWNRRDQPAAGPGPAHEHVGGHCSGKPKRLRVTVAAPDREEIVQVFTLKELEIVEHGQIRVVELPPIGAPAT